jgi:hypothetical protein
MKRITLIAIALLIATASSVCAIQVSSAYVAPVIGGIAQVVDLDPIGYAPQFDPITGQPIIDPLTGLQLMKRTWANYEYFAGVPGRTIQLQSVSLQKIIPARKVACGACWTGDPITVQQLGIDAVNLKWPLLYEVNGVEIRLTVTYNTSDRVAYPPSFGPNIASRSHVEVYSWFVKSDTWAAFAERLGFFTKLPAGTCETFAVSPVAYMKIQQFINGYGAGQNFQPGILQLISMGKPIPAAARFSDLETYMDSVCVTTCSGLYATGVNAGTPDPKAETILDNCTVPADSILINDLWAVGKALGILVDKK